MDMLKITLKKSLVARLPKHIATAEALGLRKINDITVQPNNAQTKGKVALISYLLSVEPCE